MVNLQLTADYMKKHDLAAVVATDPWNTAILKNFYSYVHLYTVDWSNHPTIVAFPKEDEPFVVDFMSWHPPVEMRPAWIKKKRSAGWTASSGRLSRRSNRLPRRKAIAWTWSSAPTCRP